MKVETYHIACLFRLKMNHSLVKMPVTTSNNSKWREWKWNDSVCGSLESLYVSDIKMHTNGRCQPLFVC